MTSISNNTIEEFVKFLHSKGINHYSKQQLIDALREVTESSRTSPGYVIVEDPSERNVVADSNTIAAPGKKMVEIPTFLRNWRDTDVLGNSYHHFGIAVCGPEDRV